MMVISFKNIFFMNMEASLPSKGDSFLPNIEYFKNTELGQALKLTVKLAVVKRTLTPVGN